MIDTIENKEPSIVFYKTLETPKCLIDDNKLYRQRTSKVNRAIAAGHKIKIFTQVKDEWALIFVLVNDGIIHQLSKKKIRINNLKYYF